MTLNYLVNLCWWISLKEEWWNGIRMDINTRVPRDQICKGMYLLGHSWLKTQSRTTWVFPAAEAEVTLLVWNDSLSFWASVTSVDQREFHLTYIKAPEDKRGFHLGKTELAQWDINWIRTVIFKKIKHVQIFPGIKPSKYWLIKKIWSKQGGGINTSGLNNRSKKGMLLRVSSLYHLFHYKELFTPTRL